jgi:hypothetical protein
MGWFSDEMTKQTKVMPKNRLSHVRLESFLNWTTVHPSWDGGQGHVMNVMLNAYFNDPRIHYYNTNLLGGKSWCDELKTSLSCYSLWKWDGSKTRELINTSALWRHSFLIWICRNSIWPLLLFTSICFASLCNEALKCCRWTVFTAHLVIQ